MFNFSLVCSPADQAAAVVSLLHTSIKEYSQRSTSAIINRRVFLTADLGSLTRLSFYSGDMLPFILFFVFGLTHAGSLTRRTGNNNIPFLQ